MSGDYRGRDAIFEYLEKVRDLTGGGLRSEPQDILTGDQYQMAFFRASGERHGNTMDVTYVIAIKVSPDGTFEELWFLGDDQAAYDRFWS